MPFYKSIQSQKAKPCKKDKILPVFHLNLFMEKHARFFDTRVGRFIFVF